MNHFTKEELEYIMHLCHICNSYHSSPSQNFKNKIQSMIDNYCEHKNKEMDCNGGISLVCTDCGKTILDV